MGKRKLTVRPLSPQELERSVLKCLGREVRQRDALDNFCKAAKWRYLTPSSHLNPTELSAAAFTALLYHAPLTVVQQLSDSGISEPVKEKLATLGLHSYWHECLSAVKEKDSDLSKFYFSGKYLYSGFNIKSINIESNDLGPINEAVDIQLEDAHHFPTAAGDSIDGLTPHIRENNPIGETIDVRPEDAHRFRKAVLGSLVKAPHVLQAFLYDGLRQSERRRLDAIQKKDSVTMCLSMYMAQSEGDDLHLEIWNCQMHGHLLWIAQNGDTSLLRYLSCGENGRRKLLRSLLGEPIFEAMETSEVMLAKQREWQKMDTDAPSATRDDEDYKEVLQITRDGEDYKIIIYLGFQKGYGIFMDLFGN